MAKFIDAATASVEASFDEATKNADAANSPLTDLAYSSVYYKIGTGPVIVGAKIPASNPAGGGHILQTLILPAPAGTTTVFSFQVSETDTSGNEGPLTPPVIFTIERIAPAAPSNFIIA